MATTFEPGQRAFAARFDHLPERHRESWAHLDPVTRAIWARVEAACQPEPVQACAGEPDAILLAVYRNAYAAVFRPGLYLHREAHCAGLRAVIRHMRADAPDVVVAFPGGAGTKDMVRKARAAGLPVVEAWT